MVKEGLVSVTLIIAIVFLIAYDSMHIRSAMVI